MEKTLPPNKCGRGGLFEQESTALLLIDNVNGRILDANRTACEMYGYTREEFLELCTGDLSSHPGSGRRVVRDKSRNPSESCHRKKDGSLFRVEITGASPLWEDGNVHIAAVREVDPRLQSGEELRESRCGRETLFERNRNPLNVTVDDVGESMSEHRQSEADREKMESIRNLAGGVAHDFKNIFTPIIGLCEVLLESLPSDSQQFEDASGILNAAKRGRDLVGQILAFSRQSKPEMTPIRVQEILEEAVRVGRSTVPPSVEIVQTIQSDCGKVMANPIQIRQIAMNLINNACQALEPSGGKIFVELSEAEPGRDELEGGSLKPGKYARLSVSDTGPGLDPAIIDRIFEPYFTTKERGKGTGLGLAVVYGIVKQHQGDIKVYSEVGKGSTFRVHLPLARTSARN